MLGGTCINYITTTHQLAKELLSKPDGFLSALFGGEEFVVESIKRKASYANCDDFVMDWQLNLRASGNGILRR